MKDAKRRKMLAITTKKRAGVDSNAYNFKF